MSLLKSPLCSFCIDSGTLCNACEKKLEDGMVTKLDLELIKFLNEKYHDFDVEYLSSFEGRDIIIIFMKGDIGGIVGKGGKGALELKKIFGKKIKIINMNGKIKEVVSDIIHPIKLVGINTVYKADKELIKIRFLKKDFAKMPIDINSLKKILFNLFDKDIEIVFE